MSSGPPAYAAWRTRRPTSAQPSSGWRAGSSRSSAAGWASDLAYETAPEEPYAWDARIVIDAAFGRYLRSATDYAGGRRFE